MPPANKISFSAHLRSFLFWFAFFYLVFWSFNYFFASEDKDPSSPQPVLVMQAADDDLVLGQLAKFTIQNHSDQTWHFSFPCTDGQPENEVGTLNIFRLAHEKRISIFEPEILASFCAQQTGGSITLAPSQHTAFDLRLISDRLFTESGSYEIELKWQQDSENSEVVQVFFNYDSPSWIRKLFRALVTQPLFNFLVFTINYLPTHSLGIAIILLTLLVRLLLFLPNQKAIRSQQELQKLQPKLEELRKKYGKNQQVLAIKTMEMYRTNKINPFSSIVPILAQLPFLLGTYFIIIEGVSPHLSYLLYNFQSQVDLLVINAQFLWLNLNANDWIVLPLLVAGAQFVAMKLSIGRAPKSSQNSPLGMSMQKIQGYMVWVFPMLIGGFTAFLPSGVGLYWLVSTILGAMQQAWLMSRLKKTPEARRKV